MYLIKNVDSQILFEELYKYHDEEKHPLRLHLLKEEYVEEGYRAEGKILGVMCIQKLFKGYYAQK